MAALNHPKKGDKIKVEPIKSEKDIRNIKKHLVDKPRDLAIFILGINTNLRASDLLKITIEHKDLNHTLFRQITVLTKI
jgi:hypothetical protein